MNKWLYHQNGLTKTSLSVTVTRVSNCVEENVFLLYIVEAPPGGGGDLMFSTYAGSGPASTVHPQKYQEF